MSDVINIIPSKDISFKTKSLLEDILNRLELSQRDRIDLQRYIEFGGGENLDNIKETLEFVRDNLDIFIKNKHNFEIFVEYVDKIYALFEEAPEEFDTLKEIADWIKNIQLYQIVEELPEKGEDNKIYLINSNNPLDNNKYQEYIYVNGIWEEVGGSIPLNLLDFSNNVITFAPTKQSIITPDDFKNIVEKYDLINKKGLSLPCLYKKNKSDKLGFGLLVFNYNNSYQRIDIMLGGKFSDENFNKDEQLYNPFNGYVNHAYLYNKNYNILTPLGEYQYKGNIIEKKSITYDKLADSTIESLSEEINKNIEFPDTIFEKGGGEDSAVLKQTDEKEKNTSTGKANIVGGRRNTVASHTSIAGGVDNVIRGSNSLVVGSNNNAYQRDSLVEGYYNITHDVYSHAEGHGNSSRGIASHVEGSYNETTNSNEHAQGKHNKSNIGTIHSVGIGTSDTDRKNAHEIMLDGKQYIYGVGGYDGTNPDESDDLATVIGKCGGGMTNITYDELVSLRDNSQLKPGAQYRITDYVTTTIQNYTSSEGHPFDIIVTALTTNTLSEKAKAAVHEGDTYFSDLGWNLNTWELLYCLDNDTTKFAWAAEYGKGVIYRLIDDNKNECFYDFKNIKHLTKINNKYYYYVIPITYNKNIHNNKILPYINNGIYEISYNYIASECCYNFIDYGCKYNCIKNKSKYNKILSLSNYNEISQGSYNIIGNNSSTNILSSGSVSNIIGNNSSKNTIYQNSSYNHIGDSSNNNLIGYQVYHSKIGNNSNYNKFDRTYGESNTYKMEIGNCSSYNIITTSYTRIDDNVLYVNYTEPSVAIPLTLYENCFVVRTPDNTLRVISLAKNDIQLEQLQETLKYSSLTIIVEDWTYFMSQFNEIPYDEVKNNIINIRYGDRTLGNLTFWELCDNLNYFSKIDMELKIYNSEYKLQGSSIKRNNNGNDEYSYEFIFGSIIPSKYGLMIHMIGGPNSDCYTSIFEI